MYVNVNIIIIANVTYLQPPAGGLLSACSQFGGICDQYLRAYIVHTLTTLEPLIMHAVMTYGLHTERQLFIYHLVIAMMYC